ncbi:MAG: acetylxylan esterase, partial [Candidatus Brockarchaeota archaeon]|nr:acetylxylan esterase [Candidatus Brockarchaeota archaeon]
MTRKRRLLALLFAASIALALPRGTLGEDYASYYDYDPSAPLNSDVRIARDEPKYTLLKVYFDSVNGERVPALLSMPKGGGGPFPCILFLHGYGGEKEDIIPLAEFVAEAGYAVIAIDAQYHGERRKPGVELYSTNMTRSRDGFIQTVVDARRALDYLGT